MEDDVILRRMNLLLSLVANDLPILARINYSHWQSTRQNKYLLLGESIVQTALLFNIKLENNLMTINLFLVHNTNEYVRLQDSNKTQSFI